MQTRAAAHLVDAIRGEGYEIAFDDRGTDVTEAVRHVLWDKWTEVEVGEHQFTGCSTTVARSTAAARPSTPPGTPSTGWPSWAASFALCLRADRSAVPRAGVRPGPDAELRGWLAYERAGPTCHVAGPASRCRVLQDRSRLPVAKITANERPSSKHAPARGTTRSPGQREHPGQGHNARVRRQGLEPRTRGLRVRCNKCSILSVYDGEYRRLRRSASPGATECRPVPGADG
jgi:hypothetical protein